MCHTIVDQQSSYDHIMSVDITCHFVTSMLSFSPKQLNFYIKKVGEKILSSFIHQKFR